jgi:hypothetical protein
MWHNITYLFMYHEPIVRKLFSGDRALGIQVPEESKAPIKKRDLSHYIRRIRKGEFAHLSKRVWLVFIRVRKKLRFVCDHFVIPFLLVGRVFRIGSFDQMTQFSSGRSDALIFFDELEVEAHKRLLGIRNIYVAQYPIHDNCRCGSSATKSTTILSPLSGFEGWDRISEELLAFFYRDFKAALNQAGARNIHLRVHPRGSGNWAQQLRNYLVDRGIDASIVGCDKPIRDIICDYMGVVGYASAAFRDARASCDYAFVVGFEAVSSTQFSNPKFVFANSEGIDWIDANGGYAEGVFFRKKYSSPDRKTIPQFLIELAKTKKKGV